MKSRYFLSLAGLLLTMQFTLSCSVLEAFEDAKKKIDDKTQDAFRGSLIGMSFMDAQGIPEGNESIITGVQFIAAAEGSEFGTIIFTSSEELVKLYLQVEGDEGYYVKALTSSDVNNKANGSYAYSVDLDFAPGVLNADKKNIKVSGESIQGKVSKSKDSENTIIKKYNCQNNKEIEGGIAGFIGSFDMGRNSGSFKFEYDTAYQPDEITIYGDSKARGTPIFHYPSGGTGDVKTQQVYFNTREITIKVVGSESGTWWGFIVNCP